ncbi:hypothetical protein [Tenacibaculum jejuense]|uniref:Lipoprotein n=1 Tax=Tenacibaculum jejuense TaxID=584609 RepID=A0A238UGB2_9FLAO|nr:hypothetical protein [Tenacibaculum jejuense]SNR17400.1 exported protein of unknown function [Tenacibaculum jejuense]
MKFKSFSFTITFLALLFSSQILTSQKKKIAKPKFGDVAQQEVTTSPNNLYIDAKILGKNKQVLDCNDENANVLLCKILKVSNQGSSIINLPRVNTSIYFKTETPETFDALHIMKGTTLQLHIKEDICKKGKQSTFTILGFIPKTKL